MSTLVLTDCFISLDETEFSGKNTNVAISYTATALDITAMGDATKKNTGGLKEWSMSFEFVGDDEATTGAFFDKVGTVIAVEVRASSAVRGVNNPSYVGQGLVTEFTPIKGKVGDAHIVTLNVVSASDLQRLTTTTP
jgi:hypothetical protein